MPVLSDPLLRIRVLSDPILVLSDPILRIRAPLPVWRPRRMPRRVPILDVSLTMFPVLVAIAMLGV